MMINAPHYHRGFSIAELMVAMTIGLLVTLAVSSLFISTRTDYRQNDATAKMQENARFAMELITQDLRHAGFLGNIADPIDIDVDTMTLIAPAQECGVATATGKSGLYNFAETRLLLSFGNQIANVGANAYYGDCLTSAEVKANSSILLIKRAAAIATPPLLADDPDTAADDTTTDERVDGIPYIYSNGNKAYLYTYPPASPPPITAGEHWEYQPRIYYIDNDDMLRRKQFVNLSLVSEPLAEGIEAFHIEFGISTLRDGLYDGAPAHFYTPATDSDSSADDAPNQAVSATLYVLARTTEADPDTTYLDTKTYKLGSTGPVIDPVDDRFHRRVYATTVALKNIRNQVMSR